jgi:uncharacterized damage-inducible protein DinB
MMKLRMLYLMMASAMMWTIGYLSAQEAMEKSDMAKMPVFCSEFLGQVDFVQGRISQLADEVPQKDYTWRPAKGVRSISEVYRHVSFGNYAFIKFAGYEVPADAKFDMDPEKWDTAITDKKEIADAMEKSFATVKMTAKKITEEDLNKTVHFFGMDMSLRNFMVTMLNHMHEHLGQSIAYARSVGVTPPWTAKAQAQEGTK